MKILQVINNLGSGGAEKLIYDFVPIMKNLGYEVEICLFSRNKSIYIEELERKGIKIHILNKNNDRSFFNILKLRKILKRNNYNIVHLHLFPGLYYGVFANLFLKNRLIYTEHNTNNRRRNYKIFQFIEKWIYSKYEKIICISKKTKESLINFLKCNYKEKFIVIENGIKLEKFYEAKEIPLEVIDSSLKQDDIKVTMVGRFSEQKDQKTLIKAMKHLPEKYKLLLVGEGKLEEECREEVKNLGLENRVLFLGVRRDIENIFKSSDIAVLSSKWEGFGLVAVEAMATGLEVIGTNVAGLREVINNSENLFEVGNYKQLAQLILSKEGKIKTVNKEYLNKYDIEVMTKKYLNIYKNVILEGKI